MLRDPIGTNFPLLKFVLRVVDLATLFLTGEASGLLRFGSVLREEAQIYSVLLYFCCSLAFILFAKFDFYESWRGRSGLAMCGKLAFTWAGVLLTGLLFSYLLHQIEAISRLWLLYWFATGTLFILSVRWACFSLLCRVRRRGFNRKTVVIVGYGAIGVELHERALQRDWYGYEVMAVHASGEEHKKLDELAVTNIERLEDIADYVVAHGIDEIWIALSIRASDKLERIQYSLRNVLVDIKWIPDTIGVQLLSNRVGDFLGFPAVDINMPAASGLNGLAKVAFDKLFCVLALALLSPLLAVIAIGIKASSPGPVLFRQPRLGLNGREFNVYKFRTMKHHDEVGVIKQAKKGDQRITKLGLFLRRTSLDELPQFFNVLLGDMSIVGPRPHALQHNQMYSDLLETYMIRHRVKPGITGWAQINGYRGETDTLEKMKRRVQCDVFYIRNWSMSLDLRIIAWTAFKGWTGKNAY